MRVSTSVFLCGAAAARLGVSAAAAAAPRAAMRAAMLAAVSVVALAACTPDPDEKAPQCPVPLVPKDAASITRYDGRGTDLTDLVYSARLVNVVGTCKGMLGHNNVKASAHAELIVTRGPAAQGREIDLPYNLAVVRDGAVIDHRELVQHIAFPPNVDTVRVTGEERWFTIPAPRGLGAQNYKLYYLLALTPAELEANRKALAGQ